MAKSGKKTKKQSVTVWDSSRERTRRLEELARLDAMQDLLDVRAQFEAQCQDA